VWGGGCILLQQIIPPGMTKHEKFSQHLPTNGENHREAKCEQYEAD
jgi:hypothetical protein